MREGGWRERERESESERERERESKREREREREREKEERYSVERETEKRETQREKQSETKGQDKSALIRGIYPYLNRLSCSCTEPVSVTVYAKTTGSPYILPECNYLYCTYGRR